MQIIQGKVSEIKQGASELEDRDFKEVVRVSYPLILLGC